MNKKNRMLVSAIISVLLPVYAVAEDVVQPGQPAQPVSVQVEGKQEPVKEAATPVTEEKSVEKLEQVAPPPAVVTQQSVPTASNQAVERQLKQLDQLAQELENLKGQAQKADEKSLGRWLTIGGSYRFRMDRLSGKTVAYANAIETVRSVGASAGGPLFTASTMDSFLTSTLPVAMYNVFTASPAQSFQTRVWNAVTGWTPAPQLTSRQQNMLRTLERYVLPGVYAGASSVNIIDPSTSNPASGSSLRQQWDAVVAQYPSPLTSLNYEQAANQLMLLDLFGNPSTSPGSSLQMIPAQKVRNATLYTNKFALDLTAAVTKSITADVRFGMYKVFGSQDSDAVTGNAYFSDRAGVVDGTLGHVPSSSYLNVDRAYVTWSNIAEMPVWFSVGRRPTTSGSPQDLKSNYDSKSSRDAQPLLVNSAFDGAVLGYAPEIGLLPGFSVQVSYGRGVEAGFNSVEANSVKDSDLAGVSIVPVDNSAIRLWLQWNRLFNVFDTPALLGTDVSHSASLGTIDWFGGGAQVTLKKFGSGNLITFADAAVSVARPNENVSYAYGLQGLVSGEFLTQDFNPVTRNGYAILAGVRYDFPSKTKLGFEYNYGSKYWVTYAAAADDMWTSKVGVRGQVFEPYLIQELNLKPISSAFAKVFFKLGYQYYDFKYTGSNSWVGEPVKISEIKSTDLMLMAPVRSAQNFYGTFEVHF